MYLEKKNIFALNLRRYKDESDYALKFMESSWRDMQKEEARRWDEKKLHSHNVEYVNVHFVLTIVAFTLVVKVIFSIPVLYYFSLKMAVQEDLEEERREEEEWKRNAKKRKK